MFAVSHKESPEKFHSPILQTPSLAGEFRASVLPSANCVSKSQLSLASTVAETVLSPGAKNVQFESKRLSVFSSACKSPLRQLFSFDSLTNAQGGTFPDALPAPVPCKKKPKITPAFSDSYAIFKEAHSSNFFSINVLRTPLQDTGGVHSQPSPYPSSLLVADIISFRTIFLAHPCTLTLIKSYSCKKHRERGERRIREISFRSCLRRRWSC